MNMPARLCVLLIWPLVFTSCTSSLEKLVEEHHQQRIDDSIANSPVAHGGADGTGSYIADTSPRISVETPDPPKAPNP